jgi:hypothetical protein
MCNPVGGGAATQGPTSAKGAEAAPTKVAAAKGGGCGGGDATQFEPGSNVAALHDQLADGLRQLQSMGVNTGKDPGQHPGQFGMPPVNGGGPMSRFQQIEQIAQTVALVPSVDGASALENLRRMSAARDQRVAHLQEAFAADQQVTGSINPVDAQKLQLETQLAGDVHRMIEKLTPLASTIDASEAASLVKLVSDSNARGRLDPAQLARVLVNIEGTAANLPASYLASANRAQDFAASVDARLDQLSNRVAQEANQTGNFDPAPLQQVSQLAADRAKLSDALKRNFDLAKQNPSEAQSRLDRALQSNDLATVIAALG